MISVCRRAGWLAFGALLACIRLEADNLFVAPDGTSFGTGSVDAPYSLAAALSGQVSQPGDTFWLRGGDYKLGHLDTTIEGAPGLPITFRQAGGERARIDGSFSIFNSAGYLVFRDFEMYSSDTNRVSSQTGVGFSPTDISIIPGVNCFAANCSFINLVVHDQTRHGIYISQDSTNALVYGCLIYNNGWASPDNAEGHGIYAQGEGGMRTITDNIVFNNCGANLHIYENGIGRNLVGVTLNGNTAFHAGAIQSVRAYRDWVVGVDSPGGYADRMLLEGNMGYQDPAVPVYPEIQIGRDATNGSVVLVNNYMPLGLLMNTWLSATVSGNLFAPPLTNFVVRLNRSQAPLNARWERNTYVSTPAGNQMLLDSTPYSFSAWQQATGFDRESTFVMGGLRGTRVFVRPNQYEPGRANIIVYNWDGLDNVAVDVSSVVSPGATFEVRNAQEFLAAPLLSGTYDGQLLLLPMTNLTAAVPNGPLTAPVPAGPTFNVFVLQSYDSALQITQSQGFLHLSWPIGSGLHVLQSSGSLQIPAGWTNCLTDPIAVGDQFRVTEPVTSAGKFYRLTIR
ncbi:MAG TPA: right-handed parallel beta-helix repeat-containing protein [Verrucomicrobiae bacterium]